MVLGEQASTLTGVGGCFSMEEPLDRAGWLCQ